MPDTWVIGRRPWDVAFRQELVARNGKGVDIGLLSQLAQTAHELWCLPTQGATLCEQTRSGGTTK